MHEYRIHTLVDITQNGNINKQFPFKSESGGMIHNKDTFAIARNQNANFNTMIQLLQMRGNITWDLPPERMDLPNLGNHGYGSYYEGKHSTWHFQFYSEQAGVYGDILDPTENLVEDFNLIPVLTDCTNTAHFPIQTFITREYAGTDEQRVINALSGTILNTYFSYAGPIDK